MDKNTNKDLATYRLAKSKKTLIAAETLYKTNSLLDANNRAYYAIFHALRAVLALERKDFKRHKDVIRVFQPEICENRNISKDDKQKNWTCDIYKRR